MEDAFETWEAVKAHFNGYLSTLSDQVLEARAQHADLLFKNVGDTQLISDEMETVLEPEDPGATPGKVESDLCQFLKLITDRAPCLLEGWVKTNGKLYFDDNFKGLDEKIAKLVDLGQGSTGTPEKVHTHIVGFASSTPVQISELAAIAKSSAAADLNEVFSDYTEGKEAAQLRNSFILVVSCTHVVTPTPCFNPSQKYGEVLAFQLLIPFLYVDVYTF